MNNNTFPTLRLDLLVSLLRAEISGSGSHAHERDLPKLLVFEPPAFFYVGVVLYLISDVVLFADVPEIFDDLKTRRMKGGPLVIGRERERVEDGGSDRRVR